MVSPKPEPEQGRQGAVGKERDENAPRIKVLDQETLIGVRLDDAFLGGAMNCAPKGINHALTSNLPV